MLLTAQQMKDLRTKMHDLKRADPEYCKELILIDGKQFRLEHKPHGDYDRLRKAGYSVIRQNGGIYIEVPNGIHGADYLGVDTETGEIVCLLCKGAK